MPPKIRWNKAQTAELYRDVRAFNAARTRAIKKNPEVAKFLPEKLNVQDLRQSIKSRQELKALTADVNRQLKFKFETTQLSDGTIITRKEFEDVRALVEIGNETKRKVAKQRGVKVRESGRMGTEQQSDLALFRTDIENISGKDWNRFRRVVESKLDGEYYSWEEEAYKEQYIEVLWAQLGPGEDTLEIAEMIAKIPARVMLQAARENPEARIGFIYPNDPDEVSLLKNRLKTIWSSYV